MREVIGGPTSGQGVGRLTFDSAGGKSPGLKRFCGWEFKAEGLLLNKEAVALWEM